MLYWIGFYTESYDYRPLTFPPNDAILGWWCTGFDSDDNAMLCALVASEAWDAILKDWPEAKRRFVQKAYGTELSDRYVLQDWMKERIAKHSK